jgi:hypothetical protein
MAPLIEYCQKIETNWLETNWAEVPDVNFLNILYDTQREIKETDIKKLRNYLIIFDDCIAEGIL